MIKFHFVEYRNFLSVGDNPVKIQLDRSQTTLLTGKNGNGKSSFTDAICFALFGKSYRGIRNASLVNVINQKGCLATVEFSVGSDRYRVSRGMKPGGLFITKNGKDIDELAAVKDTQAWLEENVLGFNQKTFTNTCIIGTTNYIPFMQLSAGARREFIENLFGINIFSNMNRALKTKIAEWKTEVDTNKNELEKEKSILEVHKSHLDSVQSNNNLKISKKKEELRTLKQNATEYIKIISDSKAQLAEIFGVKEYTDSVFELKEKELETLTEIVSKVKFTISEKNSSIKKLDEKVKQFEKLMGGDCPVCSQSVGENHVERCVASIQNTKTELESELELYKEESLYEPQNKCAQIDRQLRSCEPHLKNIYSAETAIKQISAVGKKIVEEINSMTDVTSVDQTTIEDLNKKITASETVIQYLQEKRVKLLEKAEPYKVASELLKDTGIKSVIIKQYLPILNARVNHYLTLLNFNVKFSLDENFEESLQSRNKTDFTYENFSAGEKQRLDLAMLFAWRDVASMKNTVNTNLLILDETADSNMDSSGTDDLLSIIETVCEKTNVFLVSHKGAMEDKVRSTIRFEKINGFSKIV